MMGHYPEIKFNWWDFLYLEQYNGNVVLPTKIYTLSLKNIYGTECLSINHHNQSFSLHDVE